MEVLSDLADDADSLNAEIDELFSSSDAEEYEVRVHALKGLCKMVGARELAALAEELERSAHKKDMDSIKNKHKRLITEYKNLAKEIRA